MPTSFHYCLLLSTNFGVVLHSSQVFSTASIFDISNNPCHTLPPLVFTAIHEHLLDNSNIAVVIIALDLLRKKYDTFILLSISIAVFHQFLLLSSNSRVIFNTNTANESESLLYRCAPVRISSHLLCTVNY